MKIRSTTRIPADASSADVHDNIERRFDLGLFRFLQLEVLVVTYHPHDLHGSWRADQWDLIRCFFLASGWLDAFLLPFNDVLDMATTSYMPLLNWRDQHEIIGVQQHTVPSRRLVLRARGLDPALQSCFPSSARKNSYTRGSNLESH